VPSQRYREILTTKRLPAASKGRGLVSTMELTKNIYKVSMKLHMEREEFDLQKAIRDESRMM
jgi:hypothetical protein